MDVTVVAATGGLQQQAPAAESLQPSGAVPQSGGVLASAPHVENTGVLSPVVAKLFGDGQSQSVAVNVSYRVEDHNIIVTVFTDPKTGKEIAQVPAEVMVQIAQFFDKENGVTLDRSA